FQPQERARHSSRCLQATLGGTNPRHRQIQVTGAIMGNASVCLPCVAQLQRALPPSTTICMIFKIAKPFMDALFAQNSGFHRLNADCEIHIAATPTAPAFGFPADIVAEPPNECRVAPPGTAGLQVLPSCRISGPLRSSRSCDSQRHLVMRCVSILRTQL